MPRTPTQRYTTSKETVTQVTTFFSSIIMCIMLSWLFVGVEIADPSITLHAATLYRMFVYYLSLCGGKSSHQELAIKRNVDPVKQGVQRSGFVMEKQPHSSRNTRAVGHLGNDERLCVNENRHKKQIPHEPPQLKLEGN